MFEDSSLTPTATDLELALAFYAVLVEVARKRQTVTYGELVELAKSTFPTNEVVQNAIAVSVGRRLDFVRAFTNQRALPDLSSFVVNKTTRECGVGFTRTFDPEEVRAQVFAFDWRDVSTEFTGVVAAARERAKPRKRVTANAAGKLMFEYYAANKVNLPPSVRDHRDQIIKRIMEVQVSEAFTQATKGDA